MIGTFQLCQNKGESGSHLKNKLEEISKNIKDKIKAKVELSRELAKTGDTKCKMSIPNSHKVLFDGFQQSDHEKRLVSAGIHESLPT